MDEDIWQHFKGRNVTILLILLTSGSRKSKSYRFESSKLILGHKIMWMWPSKVSCLSSSQVKVTWTLKKCHIDSISLKNHCHKMHNQGIAQVQRKSGFHRNLSTKNQSNLAKIWELNVICSLKQGLFANFKWKKP